MRHLLALLCLASLAAAAADTATQQAVVKIYTVHSRANFHQPWSSPRQEGSTGSGCLIGPGRIITNAHVVTDATVVQVRLAGQARRVPARVLHVAHDADLALLAVDEPGFAEGVKPIELGELPRQQDEVLVLGFPQGGDTLSATRGVVSRIEHRTYVHSNVKLLACQVDAAINPGNSGGPAIHGNRLVGVVMQGMSRSQSIGYLVPPPVIAHVLKDLEDGRYDGFPSLHLRANDVQSPAMQRLLGVAGRGGVVVTRRHPRTAQQDLLRLGDVILAADGHAIAEDGTVEFRPGERTDWSYCEQNRQIGETMTLRVWREGAEHEVAVPLATRIEDDRPLVFEEYDRQPRYFIHAGLVFVPVTRRYLQVWGEEWYKNAPRIFTVLMDDEEQRSATPEPVVVMWVLAHQANAGYHDLSNFPVDEIDGQRVASLADAQRLIETPSDRPFIELRNRFGTYVVLDRAAAKAAHGEILRTYRVPRDRSEDLK